jgi:hypothetical protein
VIIELRLWPDHNQQINHLPAARGFGEGQALSELVRMRNSRLRKEPAELHPGITQEVAPNESQRDPKATTREALIYEALFGARWVQSSFEKGS